MKPKSDAEVKRHRLKPSLFKPAITTVISLEKANMMVLPANKGANNCVRRIKLKERTFLKISWENCEKVKFQGHA